MVWIQTVPHPALSQLPLGWWQQVSGRVAKSTDKRELHWILDTQNYNSLGSFSLQIWKCILYSSNSEVFISKCMYVAVSWQADIFQVKMLEGNCSFTKEELRTTTSSVMNIYRFHGHILI